jgi:glycosyltransferase involved in cell wall biosynthesis
MSDFRRLDDRKILINAANLHVGGGLQVAGSVILEMSRLGSSICSGLDVIVSSEVNNIVRTLGADVDAFKSYRVIDLYGVRAFFGRINKELVGYDIVFTIYGPNYLRVKGRVEIVGFAQLWILQFDNEITRPMPFVQRSLLWLGYQIKWGFFSVSDFFIVELDHVGRKLVQRRGVPSSRIRVVHNAIADFYYDKSRWSHVDIGETKDEIRIGVVSRDYIHKNLGILPELSLILLDKYGLNVKFFVTFSEAEWSRRDVAFRESVRNVGALRVNQCPAFYEQMDGVIFPSLLECFSVTPLEALVMGRPLFAADRDFVRDVCADFAFYFNPTDVYDIARVVADYFLDASDRSEFLSQAREHGRRFSSARDRALKYLNIIDEVLGS